MSYSPLLHNDQSMVLLTGVQSTTNASPTTSSVAVPWITLPPTNTDGISFDAPVLVRGVIATTNAARGRAGDYNDQGNYKEQAAVVCIRTNVNDALYAEISDDEVVFYRSSSSTIKPVAIGEWIGSGYSGMSFDSTYTRYLAMRLG